MSSEQGLRGGQHGEQDTELEGWAGRPWTHGFSSTPRPSHPFFSQGEPVGPWHVLVAAIHPPQYLPLHPPLLPHHTSHHRQYHGHVQCHTACGEPQGTSRGPLPVFLKGLHFSTCPWQGQSPSSVLAPVDEPSLGWALMRGRESSCPWLSCSCVWF